MFKMQTNKATGETIITTIKSGHKAIFKTVTDSVLYIGIMKGLFVTKQKKTAGEPYPVRSLNPGKYPVRVNENEIKRRYGNGKL